MLDAGEVLRPMRKEKGWSLRKTEEKSGINYQTINNIELGKSGATLYVFQKLLDTFGYKLEVVKK